MNPEPLPCPFCGSDPQVKSGKVKCVNKDCKVQPKTVASYANDQDAINDWNIRFDSQWG